jgi:ETC complex I subunit conserved region
MTVRIYQPAKSTTQSGHGKSKSWRLEFELDMAKSADPLMGWVSSSDTRAQLKLAFPTEAAAVAYAMSKGLAYIVIPSAPRALKLQSYADNFR